MSLILFRFLVVPVVVTAVSIPSEESFGLATVSAGVVATSIPSEEAFGLATVSAGVVAASIPSEESFGLAAVSAGVVAASIPSEEAFGTATVSAGVTATSIPSEESFGVATVSAGIIAFPIPSEEAFGVASVSASIFAFSIPSEEAFGLASVSPSILAFSIPSEEAFGVASVSIGVLAFSIPSEEAFGIATVSGPAPPPVPQRGGGGRFCDPYWGLPATRYRTVEVTQQLPVFEKIETYHGEKDPEYRQLSKEELLTAIDTAQKLLRLAASDNVNESETAMRTLAKLLKNKSIFDEVVRHMGADTSPGTRAILLQLTDGETTTEVPGTIDGVSAFVVSSDASEQSALTEYEYISTVMIVPGLALMVVRQPMLGAGIAVASALIMSPKLSRKMLRRI